jgi:polar amino acid transport system permease protein
MLRAGVLGVDRGQILAGQALGMTPAVLMRRIIAPQAIRTMIPAFGNESVSALKNSSLASVIEVEELTLRSTQLASSTFDFFSIFFASRLIYLLLTGAVSAIQLGFEWLLDLDRTPVQRRLADYLPWRRVDLATKLKLAGNNAPAPDVEPAAPVELANTPPLALRRKDRAKRAATIARNNTAVEVNYLHKRYGAQNVLNGLDMAVHVGEVLALLGPSGSGKSTLLRNWDFGTVRVGGRRLGYHDDGTAKENVAGPLRWVHGMTRIDADRRAAELLERVGLSHRAYALPRHLSGGQQQRVAIARALAPNPSVLLLDEPTSALGPELVNEVLEVIRRLAIDDGLTMIISTHQIRFADEVADRVAFLSRGTIIEEGPAHEVLSSPRHALTARFLSVMEADKAPEAVR